MGITTNAADQVGDPNSFLSLMKSMLRLRAKEPSLHAGDYSAFACGYEQVMCFSRSSSSSDVHFLVFINLGSTTIIVEATAAAKGDHLTGRIVIDSIRPRVADSVIVHLEAEQSLVVALDSRMQPHATLFL